MQHWGKAGGAGVSQFPNERQHGFFRITAPAESEIHLHSIGQGNKTRAAELLWIPLRTLYDRLKKHSLE